MLRTSLVALCTVAMLAAMFAARPAPTARAQEGSLQLITEFILPNSNDVKFPHVVAGNNQVHASGNAFRRTAFAWSKAATATSFPNPVNLGPAEGQPDYSPTSITLGPDGSVWAAWINQAARTIFVRQRSPQGEWGPTRIVNRGSPFPVSVEVAVSSTNQIFVAWRDPGTPVRFRTSTDGVNWSSLTNVTSFEAYASPLGLAAGPNGQVALTFTAGAGDVLHVFAGLWNPGASRFEISQVTAGGDGWADSSVSFDRLGRVYVAWRGIADRGPNSGAYYAERQPDGSWPRSRLTSGRIIGTVNINADEQNNLHLSWIGQPSGAIQPFYAFKPSTGNFRGPLASAATGTLFNPRAYGSITAASAYNHMVSEEFTGSGLRTRYSLFGAGVVSFGGRPVIEGDAPRIARSSEGTVLVSFSDLQGTPNQIRWRWNAPPTDAASDSNGWQSFSNPLRVPVPEALYNDTSCLPSTLFTQLRDTRTGEIEAEARSDSIEIDGVVEVWVYLENPMAKIASSGNAPGDAEAPGGAPDYTRYQFMYLNIIPDTDCSGLTTARIGNAENNLTTTYSLGPGGFSGFVPIPGFNGNQSRPWPVVVEVRDGAGNVQTFNLTINYDNVKPRLNLQSASVTSEAEAIPHPQFDLLQTLRFNNIPVDDDYFPDEIWGVWVANSPERVADPLRDQRLRWFIVPASGVQNGTFDIKNWSLASGLSRAQLVAGEEYYLYVRFLDAAGNATDEYVEIRVPSSNLTPPRLWMPRMYR
ncbi:MAG: hypothetical protein ACUVS4_06705 [Chloroflexaceae bacterium]